MAEITNNPVSDMIEAAVKSGDKNWPDRLAADIGSLLTSMESDRAAATESKDLAYWERTQLVALLSKLFPSHLSIDPTADQDFEKVWRHVVCIHTPAGQATWHIHDSELSSFSHLSSKDEHWDGHSVSEKYDRLRSINAQSEL